MRQERDIDLAKGRNEVRFSDVAALIDPTTVSFESLTDPKGTSVLEQSFQFDLVSTEKLLARYIDRPITVDQIRAGHGAKGLFGVHTWVAVKPAEAEQWTVYEVIGWRLGRSPSVVVVSHRFTGPALVWGGSRARR